MAVRRTTVAPMKTFYATGSRVNDYAENPSLIRRCRIIGGSPLAEAIRRLQSRVDARVAEITDAEHRETAKRLAKKLAAA